MKLEHTPGSIPYIQKDMIYRFLPTGDIYSIENQSVMINGLIGSKKEGSANNIWLRIYHANASSHDTISFYPLLGISSPSQLKQGENSLMYYGSIHNIRYEITFKPMGNIWFWDIRLEGQCHKADLVYGQDLGMASKGALLENELYAAQYLGHTIFEDECGYHICSRQNLPQDSLYPFVRQGMLFSKVKEYSTDGMQFFGLSYKASNTPEALTRDLESKNLQFENSYIALQSETFSLEGSSRFVFYGCFKSHHPDAVTSPEYTAEITAAFSSFSEDADWIQQPKIALKPSFGAAFTSPQWSTEDIIKHYPDRILEEWDGDTLLSFFTSEYTHVVLQAKELLTERPHGNIITTQADTEKVNNRLITSTNYMYGLFNCQTVIGNTSKHKFLSASRGLLNILKNSGQRIYVFLDGVYRQLLLPAVYEAGFHYSKWLYQLEESLLQVISFATANQTRIVTEVSVINGPPLDFIVTNQLVMGSHEFTSSVEVNVQEGIMRFYPESMNDSPCPGLHYDMYLPETDYFYSDDRIFFDDNMPQNGALLSLSLNQKAHFQLIINGFLESSDISRSLPENFEKETKSYQNYYQSFLNHFYLEKEGMSEVVKLNAISRWYTHNALVHFAVPHGLEQPGGAAWGTRDICQGPLELFLTTGKYTLARNVLLNLFSHQFASTGEWPQWFMFDGYKDCQEECHGDVILWPLKCVSDYIKCSGDNTILDEFLPYAESENAEYITLTEHIKLAVASIEKRFISETYLVSYAGGDWDDTLQPANESLKKCLVSSWTQALAYQVIVLLSDVYLEKEPSYAGYLGALSQKIKEAFLQYLVIDGITAGFVYRSPEGSFYPMLHPSDDTTGIHLRLLPLTRSIISELANPALAKLNLDLIEEKLHFPDGVRLMDSPASYSGGTSKLFLRAEQAANVGREISLQYVHAHIRYMEALCKVGQGALAWKALLEITPIGLKDYVKNSAYRQSNLYFSSSEGAFYDRYEYSKDFQKLYDGSITVKGGWRIYSSGPGIYLSRLIGNILGIRIQGDSLVIDPVLPLEADGLRLTYTCFGVTYTFIYQMDTPANGKSTCDTVLTAMQNGKLLPSQLLPSPYRAGGILINKAALLADCHEIHIRLSCPSQ